MAPQNFMRVYPAVFYAHKFGALERARCQWTCCKCRGMSRNGLPTEGSTEKCSNSSCEWNFTSHKHSQHDGPCASCFRDIPLDIYKKELDATPIKRG